MGGVVRRVDWDQEVASDDSKPPSWARSALPMPCRLAALVQVDPPSWLRAADCWHSSLFTFLPPLLFSGLEKEERRQRKRVVCRGRECEAEILESGRSRVWHFIR